MSINVRNVSALPARPASSASLQLLITVLSLLAASGQAEAQPSYRDIAREQTSYIQTHFYDSNFNRYYDSFPVDPKKLPWTTTWANGVQVRVLVEAVRDDPATYVPVLSGFAEGLRQYWDPDSKGSPPGFNAYCSGPGGDDKYYDDNAWMVLGFLEAYDATHNPEYLTWARQTQAFVMSGWDDRLGGGIYWSLKHQSKNACVNAPAALGALRLAALGDADQAQWATRIMSWTNSTLKDSDGLYWDNIALDGTVGKAKYTYNTGLMIESEITQFTAQGNHAALQDAERSADAAIDHWQDPATGEFSNGSAFSHLLCESLIQLYGIDHDVRYLNAVRRYAAFVYRSVRDSATGGYWNDWETNDHRAQECKLLLQNASVARLFWILSPYPNSDELTADADRLLGSGNVFAAQTLLQQAADSDADFVEARYDLWRLLLREHETIEASAQEQKLMAMSSNPELSARLKVLGWTAPTTPTPTSQ